jgi:hypothetical protein
VRHNGLLKKMQQITTLHVLGEQWTVRTRIFQAVQHPQCAKVA